MPIDHDQAEKLLHELLSDRPDPVVDLAIATRRTVHKAAKKSGHNATELVYQTYAVSDVFSFTHNLGQAFIHVASYASHVNLGFNYGAKLPDPNHVLEGTGKSIRHFKLKSPKDLKTKVVRELITAAVGQGVEMAESKGGIQPSIFEFKSKKK